MADHDKPLVTVIVPAYNHEAWVEETIISIVNQTYGFDNIQLIVTDDCSSDNTPKILSELALKYNFELILHQQNKGICLTINEMIALAKGKYIAGIASDDIMILDRIDKQIEILRENPDIDILAGSCLLIDKDGVVIQLTSKNNADSLITYDFEDLFLRLKPGFPAGSAMIKSELYQRIGTYDPKFKIEDYYFWLKAAYNHANIQFRNFPVFYYRLHNASTSSNPKLMDEELHKILLIYKSHPQYYKASQGLKLDTLLKMIFASKTTVINYLFKNPTLLTNRKVIKIIAMLVMPSFMLQQKFPEYFSKFSTN